MLATAPFMSKKSSFRFASLAPMRRAISPSCEKQSEVAFLISVCRLKNATEFEKSDAFRAGAKIRGPPPSIIREANSVVAPRDLRSTDYGLRAPPRQTARLTNDVESTMKSVPRKSPAPPDRCGSPPRNRSARSAGLAGVKRLRSTPAILPTPYARMTSSIKSTSRRKSRR